MTTGHTFHYYHSPDFSKYNFGTGHAFSPVRQELTYDLSLRAGLLRPEEVVAPTAADESAIALFHKPQYIHAVKRVGFGEPASAYPFFGLGTADNPVFSGMHAAAAYRVGATLAAAKSVSANEVTHAANFGGGLHHAGIARAAGFCIYNDIGVAIAWLRHELDCKVAYIDFDAHHGDGVQWGFYDDPDVLTVSIHESGRNLFPGTGDVDEIGEGEARGTSVNIPLQPHTTSGSWWECVESVLPEVLDAFRPDLIITQHGCDTHRLDPLTHLSVSIEKMDQATRLAHKLAHDLCEGRWVALGGGGYAIWQVVPRAWALVWASLCERPLPDRVPTEWLYAWKDVSPVPLPEYWYDVIDETPIKDSADLEAVWRAEENRKTSRQARTTALRYLRKRRVEW